LHGGGRRTTLNCITGGRQLIAEPLGGRQMKGKRVADSVLAVGDKLHIMTRRLFADDVHPHFVGEVSAVAGPLFRAEGFSFVFDSGTNSYVKHPAARTRLFSLSDVSHIINVIPQEVDLNSLQYCIVAGRLAITDSRGFSLEINEFGQSN
jgi:hypothetical protein